jgi:cation diffusion facilitator CzcD-associated flavoprotein CzcO
MPPASQQSVIIIGAGFGGIAAAIDFQQHGITDVTILEAGPAIGGTWLYNDYPGAACDIPSQLYSFSFAQRRDWDRLCSSQAEILSYLQGVAADHGVDRRVIFDTRVANCAWDAAASQWTATTTAGRTYSATSLIVATGQLNHPQPPNVPGLDSFEGEAFHSARWNHDYDLTGKRVGVIGTGASAVQFLPPVAEAAGHTTVFQRTGNWFMPRRNRPYPAPIRAAIRFVPGLQRWRRQFIFEFTETLTRSIRNPKTVGRGIKLVSTIFMRWQLRGDRELRKKVWPDYTFGCKRVLFSSFFLQTLRRPDVELVTDRITEITPTGVKTADGKQVELDCLIYGTGFRATEFMLPMEIAGTGGLALREAWSEGAHAHLGMTVPGFPNLFVMYGPNTNTSGGSIIAYLEWQAAYIRQAIQFLAQSGATALEVRPEVEQASDVALQANFAGTAWLECDSWYKIEGGRIVTNWPGYMRQYRARTHTLDPTEFTLTGVPSVISSAA